MSKNFKCNWCKDTKKLLLVDSYVDCTECRDKIIYSYNIPQGKTIILPEIHSLKPVNPINFIDTPFISRIKDKTYKIVSVSDLPTSADSPTFTFKPIKPAIKMPLTTLFGSTTLNPGENKILQIDSGKYAGFKPKKISIICRFTCDPESNVCIKIFNIFVAGISQLGNKIVKDDTVDNIPYLDSTNFNTITDIDWLCFGSENNQKLEFHVMNPHFYNVVSIAIMIQGVPVKAESIGKI